MAFVRVCLSVFLAEMGDKTQLLLIALATKYRIRQIVLGSGLAILLLCAMAVAAGRLIGELLPVWLVRTAAGFAFFYFAYSAVKGEKGAQEARSVGRGTLAVFSTFFLAELGDKTQMSVLAFGAGAETGEAMLVFLGSSLGLFLADVAGMGVGLWVGDRIPRHWMMRISFAVFFVFGILTLQQGYLLLLPTHPFAAKLLAIPCATFTLLRALPHLRTLATTKDGSLV